MGLFGAIGGLFGGGGTKSYRSPYTGEYEKKAKDIVYDKIESGPVSVNESVTPYRKEFGESDEAKNMYRDSTDILGSTYSSDYDPSSYSTSYNPESYSSYNFDYASTPQQYYDEQYGLGAKTIKREGQDQLEQLQEAIGTRRPGLLLKAGRDNQRDTAEQLATLNQQLRSEAAKESTDLSVQQQQDQAVENFKAAGFSDEQAQALADKQYQAAQFKEEQDQFKASEGQKEYQSQADLENAQVTALQNAASGLGRQATSDIASKSTLRGQEQDLQDNALDYLLELYKSGLSSSNAAAQNQQASNKSAIDTIGSIASIASMFSY